MKTRITSVLVGAPFVLAIILWPGGTVPFPGWPFAAVILALLVLALREFYDACRLAGLTPRDPFGIAAGILFLIPATGLLADGGMVLHGAVTALVMVSLVVEALRRDRAPLKSLPATWMGALYIGWLLPFAVRLRQVAPETISRLGWEVPASWMAWVGEGAWLVFFTLLITNAADTGAYFVGKTWGHHKMAPAVSPGKTWEGAGGGFAAAVITAGLLGSVLQLPLSFALTAGVLIGVVAPLGDLSKSAIKREIGIKDFGTLIPGHGGVLDRFDSLLFTAPAVYWLLLAWTRA